MTTGLRPSIEEALGTSTVAAILGPLPANSDLWGQRERKLAELWSELLALYKPENAILWLKSPNDIYSGRTPLEVAREEGGLDRVLAAVGRLAWGIPS